MRTFGTPFGVVAAMTPSALALVLASAVTACGDDATTLLGVADAAAPAAADAAADAADVSVAPSDATVVDAGPPAALVPAASARVFGVSGVAGSAIHVATDENGGVVIAGGFEGKIDFGAPVGTRTSAGDVDLFVAKYDAAGTPLWAKTLGDAAFQAARAVAVGPAGQIAVVGSFEGTLAFGGATTALASAGKRDAFVAVLSAAGAPTYAVRWGDADDQLGVAAAFAPSGDLVVAGDYYGTIAFGGPGGGAFSAAGGGDVFLVALDPAGATKWSHAYGDDDSQTVGGLAVDGTGAITFVGSLQGAIDFGPPLVPSDAGATDASADAAADASVEGGVPGRLASGGSEDLFVAHFDPAGAHLWSHAYGGPGAQRPDAVAVDGTDGTGTAVVVGTFEQTLDFGAVAGARTSHGATDVFAVAIGADGVPRWCDAWGDVAQQWGSGVAIRAGKTLITGYALGGIDFGDGAGAHVAGPNASSVAVAATLDGDGHVLRSFGYGGAGDATSSGAALGPNGEAYVVGTWRTSIDFGIDAGALAAPSGYDLFLARLP